MDGEVNAALVDFISSVSSLLRLQNTRSALSSLEIGTTTLWVEIGLWMLQFAYYPVSWFVN
jgi:hypothetical protein